MTLYFSVCAISRVRDFGDNAADVPHRGHELLLDGLLEGLVTVVADLLTAPARGPKISDHLLSEAIGSGADDRNLLLDRLQEPLIRAAVPPWCSGPSPSSG